MVQKIKCWLDKYEEWPSKSIIPVCPLPSEKLKQETAGASESASLAYEAQSRSTKGVPQLALPLL